MKYIDVVIDNKSNSTDSFFTYKCEDDSVRIGSKVHVPFARSKKMREGYVAAVKDDPAGIDDAVGRFLNDLATLGAMQNGASYA